MDKQLKRLAKSVLQDAILQNSTFVFDTKFGTVLVEYENGVYSFFNKNGGWGYQNFLFRGDNIYSTEFLVSEVFIVEN